jgi:hypothetical protein
MLRPKPISAGIVSLAKVVARVVVAACLASSFFASLLPLRASANAGVMACCAGKAGHCNSGLAAQPQAQPEPKPAPKPEPDPEPMCGQKPSVGKAIAEAVTEDAEVIDANEQAQDTTQSSTPDATAALQSATLTKPCPADCRAGAAGVVRQPRPRELALLAKNTRGSLPEPANWEPHSLRTNLAAAATLKRSRPRGPPSSS